VGIVGRWVRVMKRDSYAARNFIFFCLTVKDSRYRLKLSQ
jgi:hypothetical protein